ncbi:MAG: hypothetical protein SO445_08325 [Lachnospiraceae bacterium]|nr:hypothetical protein [Lachnospiraceae bacterium]MDD7378637.1 hypothetical protein [Lachnospiraceae bacterium]MDY4617698.1 hypothetical protein [Lachnospiraceae bacterium]
MVFINRKKELNSFKSDYEINTQNNKSQVYIIEADHGVGKSEFIREVSKFFSYFPLDIYRSDNNEELSTFKRLVLELDKISSEYQFDDFKTFYRKKTNNTKAIQLILKITAMFGQVLIKNKGCDVEFASLIDNPTQTEKFILKAQIENLFEYAKYVFSKMHIHVVFHHAANIDSGSLDLLSKLIATSKGSVFIFESDSDKSSIRIEEYIHNSHSIFLKRYQLNKLSNVHIQTYIQQLLYELKLQADNIDSSILKKSIEKGDLSEISSILKDFNDRLQKDTSTKIRSIKEIIQNLSDEQNVLLILVGFANGKLNLDEIKDIINELNNSFNMSDVDFLLGKNLIEINNNFVMLQPFVYDILIEKNFMMSLKHAVASGLVKNLNIKLTTNYNNRYVDILVEYYLSKKEYFQLKSLLTIVSQRLKNFNTQAERIDYFKKFNIIRQELFKYDNNNAIIFAKIAYDANLYFDALNFINLANDVENDVKFIKALVLNRCEDFEQSKSYINSHLKELDKQSSIYFNLSLVLIMNLIQLNERPKAFAIFNELIPYKQEPLYPYLIRLSNVFYNDFKDRLTIVESMTEDFYQANDNEFSGLHAIYLAYLYALTQQRELAEKSLLKARAFLGNNLIYNHMILHNEATIKFHSQEIDEDILTLLNNAKITAYDEYDQFAINNNLLVYYILCDKISSFECQKIVNELEQMLEHTNFKRFVDKIHYNLYYYYLKMYNFEKSECYKRKLVLANIEFDDNYNFKLMYETSWKLPIYINYAKD